MHVALTDILTCPRCGPRFGLVLLAHETRERRVLHGWLGCPNCRDRWLVHSGFGEFRTPLGGDPPPPAEPMDLAAADPQEAVRIAALLGVTEGHGHILIAGPAAVHAEGVARLIEDLEVIALNPQLAALPESSGVNRMASAATLPFHDAKLRGAWLSGETAQSLLDEGMRVLAPPGRIVLEPAPHDAEERLSAEGLRVLARRDDTIVAARMA